MIDLLSMCVTVLRSSNYQTGTRVSHWTVRESARVLDRSQRNAALPCGAPLGREQFGMCV